MLKLTNIVKSFNSTGKPEDKITVLNGLNLTINDGEFVTIIGQNGSGKSTTMNLITGAMFPDSGNIELNGRGLDFFLNLGLREFIARYYGAGSYNCKSIK